MTPLAIMFVVLVAALVVLGIVKVAELGVVAIEKLRGRGRRSKRVGDRAELPGDRTIRGLW